MPPSPLLTSSKKTVLSMRPGGRYRLASLDWMNFLHLDSQASGTTCQNPPGMGLVVSSFCTTTPPAPRRQQQPHA